MKLVWRMWVFKIGRVMNITQFSSSLKWCPTSHWHMPTTQRFRELNVPSSYCTKTGAKFKARALQYCLEDDVNILNDQDWICHMDEETLLSVNSVCGNIELLWRRQASIWPRLLSHMLKETLSTGLQRCLIHSGLYISVITNWCCFRVAEWSRKAALPIQCLPQAAFWLERIVCCDSVGGRAEGYIWSRTRRIDCRRLFFLNDRLQRRLHFQLHWRFDPAQLSAMLNLGEMHEKSPFTFSDFLQQRKRWLQGIYLTVQSKQIPIRYKFFPGTELLRMGHNAADNYADLLVSHSFHCLNGVYLDALVGFVAAVNLYMYIFGVVKSFSHKYRWANFGWLF